MSAKDLNVAVYVLPPTGDQQGSRVYNQYAYSAQIQGNGLQTLSQKNPNNYNSIVGLLYAPLPPSNSTSCSNSTLSMFPANVTTPSYIPDNNYPLVAIFPWTSIPCTQAFFAASRASQVKGAIVFNTNGGDPPGPNDPFWNLQDGGNWRTENNFPIYAIPTAIGSEMLYSMGLYSGNLSSAPYAAVLSSEFGPQNLLPRLGVEVDLNGTNVPSLWTFLIIVLAVLLGLVVCASVVMHFMQRHQRRSLQRRLQRGEVDLESLGIKKMNVPPEKINAMPMYTFTALPEEVNPVPVSPAPKTKSKSKTTETSFSQPTCPICLDDFVPNESMVRELPCKHIFHPDCIDPFLRDNSSLCPMCKKSALPPGFCPVKVTNLMVRRERLVRRMRERRRQSLAATFRSREPQTAFQLIGRWVKKTLRIGSGAPAVPAPDVQAAIQAQRSQIQATDVEMVGMQTPSNVNRRDSVMPADIANQGTDARRVWRREHLARQQQRTYDEQAENARRADEGRSLWRRGVDRVLPGMG